LDDCRCCDFDGYTRYKDLFDQLEKLKKDFEDVGAANSVIEAKITQLDAKLKEIADYVLEKCDNSPIPFMNANFDYVNTELVKLRVDVSAFKSDLTPNSSCNSKPNCTIANPQRNYKDCSCFCPVKCNNTANEISISGKCQCQIFNGTAKIIEVRNQCQTLLNELNYVLTDIVTSDTIYQELLTQISGCNSLIAQFSGKWNETTMEQKLVKYETLILNVQVSIQKCKDFLGNGPCKGKPTCTRPKVIIVKSLNCTCYTTTVINSFYKTYSSYLSYSSKWKSYNWKNLTSYQVYFSDWLKKIRAMSTSFYTQITEQVFTASLQNSSYVTLTTEQQNYQKEWDAFIANQTKPTTAPVPKCNITSCSGDTVKNCDTCKCVAVDGWSSLITTILNGVPALLAKINAFTSDDITADSKATLISNANFMKNKILSLKNYTVDYCFNLDESYVKLACLEYSGFNVKLEADIKTIENPSVSTVCKVSCPNSKWTYDPLACKCSCSITNCAATTTESFDPYNCLCVKKTTCAKVPADCPATQLLDYSKCECKDRPAA
jgi:hypothetical protein